MHGNTGLMRMADTPKSTTERYAFRFLVMLVMKNMLTLIKTITARFCPEHNDSMVERMRKQVRSM